MLTSSPDVILMNSGDDAQSLTADFSKIPGVTCTTCNVRDIWNHKNLGAFKGSYEVSVDSHDAAFLVVSPSS